MGLKDYIRKRNLKKSTEPAGKVEKSKKRRFVLQEHHASRLHFDLRLEMAGVAKSWAVPKGPSLDPAVKRLAVETEDHPVKYLTWQGIIPEGSYGAGRHMIWDKGNYDLEGDETNPLAQYHRGELKFFLHGRKVKGSFALVKMHFEGEKNQWLLIKHNDKYAEPGYELKLRVSTDEKAKSWRRMVHPEETEPVAKKTAVKKSATKTVKKAVAKKPTVKVAKKAAKKAAAKRPATKSSPSTNSTSSTKSSRSTSSKRSTKSKS